MEKDKNLLTNICCPLDDTRMELQFGLYWNEELTESCYKYKCPTCKSLFFLKLPLKPIIDEAREGGTCENAAEFIVKIDKEF